MIDGVFSVVRLQEVVRRILYIFVIVVRLLLAVLEPSNAPEHPDFTPMASPSITLSGVSVEQSAEERSETASTGMLRAERRERVDKRDG